MSSSDEAIASSKDNHALLLSMQTELRGLVATVSSHVEEQHGENKLLHERISDQHEQLSKAIAEQGKGFSATIDQIKEILASRGKITAPGIAIILSILTAFAGVVAQYVNIRVDAVKPVTDSLQRAVMVVDAREREKELRDTEVRVENAKAMATLQEAQRWVEKHEDENHRNKVTF